MNSLEANKVFGALLGTVFVLFGGSLLAEGIFHSEAPEKPGYPIEAAEPAAGAATPEAAAEDPPVAALLQTADVEKGASEFRKCQACHSGEKGGQNKVGPHLWDVVDRPVASVSDFAYSLGMKDFSESSSLHWDYDHLYHFLKSPKGYVKGTAMGFAGIKDPQDRADVIAYLRTLNDNPPPLPPAPAEGTDNAAAGDASGAASNPATTTQPSDGTDQTGTQAPAVTDPDAAQALPGAETAPVQSPQDKPNPPAVEKQSSNAPAGNDGAAPTLAADAGDATAGKAVFRKCQACHAVGEGATNKVGPELNGILGEKIASVESYNFSAALKEFAAAHPNWTAQELAAWLHDPKALVPGTKMSFPGLKSDKDIANVIAYLASFDENGAQQTK